MEDYDELLDEEALAADRSDSRRAAVVVSIAFAVIVVASSLVVVSGIPF